MLLIVGTVGLSTSDGKLAVASETIGIYCDI